MINPMRKLLEWDTVVAGFRIKGKDYLEFSETMKDVGLDNISDLLRSFVEAFSRDPNGVLAFIDEVNNGKPAT